MKPSPTCSRHREMGPCYSEMHYDVNLRFSYAPAASPCQENSSQLPLSFSPLSLTADRYPSRPVTY